MPHCASNYAWYLGKFIAGFTGMLFFYMAFLREEEFSCLCRARMRDFIRRNGEKRPGRCDCGEGTKSMLAGVGNVRTCKYEDLLNILSLRCISRTVLALGRGLPKNDNGNFDFTSESLYIIDKFCVLRITAGSKDEESATSIRRKRSAKHCVFRHCSGIVCAEKIIKRRKNKQSCVHLRVSQGTVSDYWKVCNKNDNETSKDDVANDDVNVIEDYAKICEENVYSREKEATADTRQKPEQEIKHEYCNALDVNTKSEERIKATTDLQEDRKCIEEKIFLISNVEDGNSEQKISLDCSYEEKPCTNYDTLPSSPGSSEIERKEIIFPDTKLHETVCQSLTESNTLTSPRGNNGKHSPKCINDEKLQKRSSTGRINEVHSNEECIGTLESNLYKYPSKMNKKRSQSDSSFSETIITDNRVDSMLYRELRKKSASSVKKKPLTNHVKNLKSDAENAANVKSRREFAEIEKKIMNFSDDAQRFSARQKQKNNLNYSMNKHESSSRLQKKLAKSFCENCSCDTKTRSRNGTQWNSITKESASKSYPCSSEPQYKMHSAHSRSQRSNYPCESFKFTKTTDCIVDRKFPLVPETRCSKYKPQSCKEKPTVVLFKNKRSNRPRAPERSKYENSTHSACSSSTTSTDFTEDSARDTRALCRRPPDKPPRYRITVNDQYKPRRYNTKIDPVSTLSSSSSLSSTRRYHSWTMLSQDSVCQRQETISSSSCTNMHVSNKEYLRCPKRTSTYSSSSSSSTSLTSTYRESYNLKTDNNDQTVCDTLKDRFRRVNRIFNEQTGDTRESRRVVQRSWRKPKYREEGKKKITYADGRHVRWDVKSTY